MPPKKKNNKKAAADDDWEAELGESVAPASAAAAAPTDDDANDEAETADGQAPVGGLMAALRKNRSKKQKKGKVVEDFDTQEDVVADATEVDLQAMDLASKAPAEGTVDDDEFETRNKKGKGGKGKKDEPIAVEDGEEDDGDGKGGLKSKKEKEREKKEREKARKREQAAKKKSTAAPAPAAKEPAKAVEQKTEAIPASAATETAGKKKKLPPALAALQKQQEDLRRRQEEQAKLDAEARAAAEEEERKAAEEEKRKEEQRAIKKQKEKEKKEQLKKEGKFMTKAQKEAKERQDLRNQQLLASGANVRVAGLDEGTEKKKPVYDNKKRKGKKEITDKKDDELAAAEEAKRKVEEEEKAKEEEEKAKIAAAEKAEAEESDNEKDSGEDWEALAAKDDEEVKESWDVSTDDETSGVNGKLVNGQTKQDKPAAKAKSPVDEPKLKPSGATNGETSKTVKLAHGRPKQAVKQSKSESDESSSEDEVETATQRALAQKKAEAAERRRKEHEEALAARSKDNLRSPICCILGHVDTGKTKLLDKIRQTSVQEGEAGGITQQIGATYFPVEALKTKTAVVNKDGAFEFKVPGLLVIDTPGHESFSNLRSRGSSLCNIAILVVDIMHGLEPQTLESMKLLRDRKTPFIVALNKIDRLYSWKPIANNGFQDSLEMQNKGVQREFADRLQTTKLAFAEQGFNAELFYENKSMAKNVSLVPTSAHTGEGIPDMLKLLVSLTQERMTSKLMYLSEIECTVLEVKIIEGLGTTIDVVLSNGILREGDRIVLCGLNGPIATNVRALLTPAPMRELRLKSQYVHNKEAKASLGIKIAANDLENAIAGSRLLVVGPNDDEDDLMEEVMSDLENLLGKVSRTGRGVSVQASTLGSLEALLEFLKVSKIPVSNISIGPVYKRDVMQAGIMLEKAPEFAVMLCFDVKVDKEALAYAAEAGVTIFQADIIYHLFDKFTAHMAALAAKKKEESKLLAVFPCVLAPVAIFNKKDPIVVGIDVTEGSLKLHTPLAAVKTNPVTGVKEVIGLGRVTSIERDHKQIPICKQGQPSVAVKIEGPNQPSYGRQLEEKDILYSLISRQSIDTLKEFYRDDMTNDQWVLIKKLKPLFDVP